MATHFETRLNAINQHSLAENLSAIKRGIEKESLRISTDGQLSQRPHQPALGSALTHPAITTDYSEALLEFITPAFSDVQAPLDYLDQIQHFVYANIDDELLWVNSMPCLMQGDDNIPIAQYGSSNIGQMKTIYRLGLGLRYGRLMQTIAGIHYNISFPESFWQLLQDHEQDNGPLQDFISAQYFNLIRNFQQYSPLVIYLFGASPAVCASFLKNRSHPLTPLKNNHTLHGPYATSLRMSDLGYQNDAQSELNICYNSLDSYVQSLDHAIHTPYPPYQKIGVKTNGSYQQLNANILQIENEYYGNIRPKRNTRSGERPTVALKNRGVEYIELRCVDLNPFHRLGIDATQIKFYDIFTLFCALNVRAPFNQTCLKYIDENAKNIVMHGRNPALKIHTNRGEIPFKDWADHILNKMSAVAELFDQTHGGNHYQQALNEQMEKIRQPELTPSAQLLNELVDNDINFFTFAMHKAKEVARHYRSSPLDQSVRQKFEDLSKKSIAAQQELEQSDNLQFEQYLTNYFA